MQDINLTAKEGVSEIIVRTGDAPKVHDPIKYQFDGNVSAPLDYFNSRKAANVNYFDAKLAVVEVNERGYQIILRRDPKDVFAETVHRVRYPGALQISLFFSQFVVCGRRNAPALSN